ncbi:MAG: outer membrane protein assembly factor BamD, partial [Candidatus Zixiibacteriota bacterium]
GKQQYQDHKYLKAIESFQSIVFNHPGAAVVDSAQYYLGLSYFGNKEYALAGVEFNRLLLNYPSSAYAENAQFMKAVCFFEGTPRDYALDQSELQKAIRQFEEFIIDHPDSDLLPDAQAYLNKAKERLARKYYEAGIVYKRLHAYKSAKIYFQKVVDDFTNTPYGALATYEIADAAFKMHKYDEAARLFANFAVVFPKHEKVAEARRHEVEAAFRAAKVAYDNGKYSDAASRFEKFLEKYPDSKKANDARKYLEKLKQELPVASSDESQSGS